MKTRLLSSSIEDLKIAAEIIRNGGVVAFPTETVYGLGANALNEEAVNKIFEAKGRPGDNPLIVHVSDKKQIEMAVKKITDNAKLLIDKFFPAPLTVVMEKRDEIPNTVTAGLSTVGVRMPNHEVALAFLALCNLPIAAPSANSSGKPSPTTAKHVLEDLDGKIDAIIDGGACSVGVESTVIDVSGDIPYLLRPGGITYEQLVETLGTVNKGFEIKEGETPRSPGMKYRHYAPESPVVVVTENFKETVIENASKYEKVGVLVFCEDEYPKNCIVKILGETAEEHANRLFALLREFDFEKTDIIFAEDIAETGVDLAAKNRLYRAAGLK